MQHLNAGKLSVQSAKMAMFLSLGVATALGAWYLRVRIPDSQWRRPHEAGRRSMSQGRFHEAERQHAIAVEEARALGEDDLRVALALSHHADSLVAQDRFADAIPRFERALAILEKAVGPEHPDVAPLLEHYAAPLRKLGRTAQAEAAEARARIIHGRTARGNTSGAPAIPRH